MRQKQPGIASEGYFRGEVVAIRSRKDESPLFDVRWDHDATVIDKGYLAFGLMPELVIV
jgi:hypothetical protein